MTRFSRGTKWDSVVTFHDVCLPPHSRLCPRTVHDADVRQGFRIYVAVPLSFQRDVLPAIASRPRSLAVTVEPSIDVTPAPYVPYLPRTRARV